MKEQKEKERVLKGKVKGSKRMTEQRCRHKKLSNTLQTNESSKVTSFKDKVRCFAQVEARFIGLMEVL